MDGIEKLRNFARKYNWIIFLLSVIVLIMLIGYMFHFYSATNEKARLCLTNPVEYYSQATNQSCSCFDSKTGITYRTSNRNLLITELSPEKQEPILIP